jgi:hypothetical protein
MFSSHCGLGLSIFTRRWEHRRFEDDFVARVVTLYAEELYKVLDTETDTTFKQQIDVDILTASPYVDKMSSKTASILSSRTYISPQPSNNSYASVC